MFLGGVADGVSEVTGGGLANDDQGRSNNNFKRCSSCALFLCTNAKSHKASESLVLGADASLAFLASMTFVRHLLYKNGFSVLPPIQMQKEVSLKAEFGRPSLTSEQGTILMMFMSLCTSKSQSSRLASGFHTLCHSRPTNCWQRIWRTQTKRRSNIEPQSLCM